MILSIDAGTQSIRASLIDEKGNIVALKKTPIIPYHSPQAGWAEQDPEYYWDNTCSTIKSLLAKQDAEIEGVVITTQRGTVINVDNEGKPLRPAIVWLDQRKAKMENYPSPFLKTVMKGLGLYDIVEHAILESESNWIRQNQPEIWDKTYKYLFLAGYFHFKLTGQYKESTGNMVGFVPFDHKKHQWAKPSDQKHRIFNIPINKLPELVNPSERIGYITPKASKATGIPEGVPLFAGASDKACEMLGAGVHSPNIGCLSFGTTATISTNIPSYKEVIPFFPSYSSAIKETNNTEIMIYRGFWMISWFKKEFGHQEILQAEEMNVPPETLFEEMIKEIPAGSMGLTLQPFWSPGIKNPGREAKGSIIGFGDVHTKAHIYKAILEGISYALKKGAQQTEKKTGFKMTELRVSGGGSQSDTAMQLTADIFNLPTHRPHTFETSSLGAAMLGYIGLGKHTLNTAIKEMTRFEKTFHPQPKEVQTYQKLYNEVYLKIYPQLQPLYKKIQKITGYPKK
ncbi:FGGY-family carbohydrate kinase [Flammeovirga sp. SJP92]|uniref:FGGY-family carbohydrate kinase n=1 Tax=Flammeovirga sp. SJP92 TaxID=1775430 RepID=UPI0007870A6E|nr:FGGY-family carbohydrate kinase [Flammeovirga sp. SJP92]KXX72057.1 carbohydrate kinase [Flammeovirga sp. SJP92]